MSSVESCTSDKLKQVLQLFLLPDFNVVSTTYLDLLLTHTKNAVKRGDKKVTAIVQEWLANVLKTWNENCQPGQNLISFTIKLVGSISADEATFCAIQGLSENDPHNQICTIFGFQSQDLSASIKMAFTTMLVNLLHHRSGRSWIEITGAWKEILRFAQQNHTMYVTSESKKFLSKLLILESKNENFCKDIILAVSEPLIKVTIDPETSNELQQDLLPLNTNKQLHCKQMNLLQATIELLFEIIDYTTFYDFTNPIPGMFEDLVSLESRIKIVFETTISTPMVKVVHKLVKLLVFVKLRSAIKETDEIIADKVYEQFSFGLYYHAMMLLTKNYILEFVVSKKLGYENWKRFIKIKPNIKIPKSYRFEDQNIALMILPLTATFKPGYMKEHYLFEEFINKMFDITCTPVQRLAYAVRDVILKKQNELPTEAICVSTVNYLLEMADIMDRESAVMVFQVICHSVKNFVTESEQNKKPCLTTDSSTTDAPSGSNNVSKKQIRYSFLDGDPVIANRTLLATLLNGLNIFTEKYKLKWKECVETICMLSIAQDILNHKGVDSKICILALKTCKLSIQNFMPPNLALLVDFDEYTKQIGPTLFKRIHDTHWEVQDSVLEILNTIACLSENKYPPYQVFILENHFLEVAIDLIKSESESYVRASALTFISTAVRINKLWDELLNQSNLPDMAMKIIYTESEAIVRREAVALITALYIHRKWQAPMINMMTHAMTIAAVLDLHWEVKINALEFWRHFIKSHLTDQGMLDGHFPNVTFSKHRKIVLLNETEIKQRLNKTLDELSQQYCLGVLLVTLNDESDLEVSKTSANIIGELRRILLEYKIDEPEPSPLSLESPPVIDTSYKKIPSESTTTPTTNIKVHDDVIDAIVDATDENLLSAIYHENMKVDENAEILSRSSSKETLEYIKSIRRPEFLEKTLKFDLDGYIEERSKWLENYTVSFDSVLDDILVISDQKEVNTMDCY